MIQWKPYVVAGTVDCNIYPVEEGGTLTREQSDAATRVARRMAYHPTERPDAGICMPHHFPGLMHIKAHALDGFLAALEAAGVPANREGAYAALSRSGHMPS